MLALVMVSGSFIVSMADFETNNSSDVNVTNEETGSDVSEDIEESSDNSEIEVIEEGEPNAESSPELESEPEPEPEIVSEEQSEEQEEQKEEAASSDNEEDLSTDDNSVSSNPENEAKIGTADLQLSVETTSSVANQSAKEETSNPSEEPDNMQSAGAIEKQEAPADNKSATEEPHAIEPPVIDDNVTDTITNEDGSETIFYEKGKDHSVGSSRQYLRGATCDEDGYDIRDLYCAYHPELVISRTTKILPAFGHDFEAWSEWEIVKESTKTSKGEKKRHRHCRRCNIEETQTVAIPVIPGEEESTLTYVRIFDDGNEYLAEVDEKGVARFKDFFWKFDSETLEETVKLKINDGNDKSYTFTRLANGTVIGTLPPGFIIDGNDLIINDAFDGMYIFTEEHSGVSFVSADPNYELEEPSYVMPNFTEAPIASESVRVTIPRRRLPAVRNTGNAAAEVSYSNSIADAFEEVVLSERDNSPAADKKEDQSVSSILPSSGTESGEAATNGITAYILLAIDLALALGLIIGLGVLWKLKVIKF